MELEKKPTLGALLNIGQSNLVLCRNIGCTFKQCVIPSCPVQEHWVDFLTLGNPILSCAGTLGAILIIGSTFSNVHHPLIVLYVNKKSRSAHVMI
jgi:hypothetical protein